MSDPFSQMLGQMQETLEVFGTPLEAQRCFGALPQAALAIAVESLRFTAGRLNAQADHLIDLAGCPDLNAVARSQTAFLESSAADYRDAAARLLRDLAVPSAFPEIG